MITFTLPHKLDLSPSRHNWLWYSHGDAPTDRQVISGWQDPSRPGIRMAQHYFLTDYALQLLSKGYVIFPLAGQKWSIMIKDHAQAVAFKLVFM